MNVVLFWCFHFRWWLWPFFGVFGLALVWINQISLNLVAKATIFTGCFSIVAVPGIFLSPLPPRLFSIWWLHYQFGVSWLFWGGISFLKAVACGHLALVKATFCGVCCRGHSPLYFLVQTKQKRDTSAPYNNLPIHTHAFFHHWGGNMFLKQKVKICSQFRNGKQLLPSLLLSTTKSTERKR